MNFEHLLKPTNSSLIKNIKYSRILKYYKNLKKKTNNLKLGLVRFEIDEIRISGITIFEYTKMSYVRQDLTNQNENNLNNGLDFLKKTSNHSKLFKYTLLITLSFSFIYLLFLNNSRVVYTKDFETILGFIFNFLFKYKYSSSFSFFEKMNEDFVSLILDICSHYGLLI